MSKLSNPSDTDTEVYTDKYVFFWHGPFGNWHMSDFKATSLFGSKIESTYACMEQFMMAEKALLFDDDEMYLAIMNETDPKKVKALGRKVRGFDDKIWKAHREEIVTNGVTAKFSSSKELWEALDATGDRLLVEGSPFDKIWGVGLKFNSAAIQHSSNWKGLNLLGKCITQARTNIRKSMKC